MTISTTISDLAEKHCQACEGGIAPLTPQDVQEALRNLPGWQFSGGKITKAYSFKNYHETMAFVNATAWISHRENHHPDLEVGYSRCTVRYSTHAVGGITQNDLICAAKIERLIADA